MSLGKKNMRIKNLLVIEKYQNIQIVTAKDFCEKYLISSDNRMKYRKQNIDILVIIV